ncbi:MAG: hypothetical protein AUG91_10010 [Actinobacteria bacterium 13_1_20CM_4_69_9]|nr:MAG: hypothetical protein AUG91_10010 [Actinobacteria bacterium 13_1_20CM_4_69_9]
MRVCLAVGALRVAVWMGILAHTSEAAAPAAHSLRQLQGVNFVGGCAFSHMAMDDPIVYPRQPGASHDHSFVGNATTNAFSTLRSLRAGSSTCKRDGETAAYWVPTLLLNGQMVAPAGATIYYRRKTLAPLRAFPAGFKMIAGDRHATSPQGMQITYWNCGAASSVPASTEVPTCPDTRGQSLRLHVNFPSCWDGKHLDSADHRSHMAYAVRGSCDATHPVAVPAISLIYRYPITGGSAVTLSSGGRYSAHADFFNAWRQGTLVSLVNGCLNALRHCGRES